MLYEFTELFYHMWCFKKAMVSYLHCPNRGVHVKNVVFFFVLCSKSVNFCVCQKYPNKELHPDGKESLWDARRGFSVPSHLISYAGVASCQTRIGNETFKSPLYIVAVVGKKRFTRQMTSCKSQKLEE